MPLGDEYIQWPGEATFPGKDTYPAYDASAAGNKTVHSHKGWEWVESENPFQQAVASLANAAIATAVQRSRTTFGQVYYQRGNSTDPPGFPGTAIGDTCRIQDPGTLDIVAEWKWNGTAWEKALVSGQQISNLDVGRLTAGSAAINELAARRIAGDVGKFLQISTDQLVVSGQATINTAVVQEIWSKIIHAQEGEFERIKAGMISGNAFEGQTFTGGTFEGQVITGAQIQTAKTGGRVLLNPTGLFAYRNDGTESFAWRRPPATSASTGRSACATTGRSPSSPTSRTDRTGGTEPACTSSPDSGATPPRAGSTSASTRPTRTPNSCSRRPQSPEARLA